MSQEFSKNWEFGQENENALIMSQVKELDQIKSSTN